MSLGILRFKVNNLYDVYAWTNVYITDKDGDACCCQVWISGVDNKQFHKQFPVLPFKLQLNQLNLMLVTHPLYSVGFHISIMVMDIICYK